MTEPISPNEAGLNKESVYPDVVIKTWNDCLTEKWDGESATILLKDIRYLIAVACEVEGIPYKQEYLNIVPLYRAKGWKVVYEKPDCTESFNPYFEFTKGRKRK